MNDLENLIEYTLDVIVEVYSIHNDLSRNIILSRNRQERVVEARCLLVSQMSAMGYTTKLISQYIHRSPQTVRNLLVSAQSFHRSSKAYRLAESAIDRKVSSKFITNKQSANNKNQGETS